MKAYQKAYHQRSEVKAYYNAYMKVYYQKKKLEKLKGKQK